MKYIVNFVDIILSSIGFLASTHNAQAFPTVDDALSKINLSKYENQIYSKTGLHVYEIELLPKIVSNENTLKSNLHFTTYTSSSLEKMFYTLNANLPKDECYITFYAQSSNTENSDLEVLNFDVVYTRLKNGVLTNTWEYKKTDFEIIDDLNQTQTNGKTILSNVIKALMQSKKTGQNTESEKINVNEITYSFVFDFNMMSSIDSITYQKKSKDENFNLGDSYIIFYGTFQNYLNYNSCFPYESGTYKLITNVYTSEYDGKKEVQLTFDVKSTSLKSIANPKVGFKTGTELTFAELYKKSKKNKCESVAGIALKYESPEERKIKFIKCIKNVLANQKQLITPEKLLAFTNPENSNSYDKFITLFKSYEVQKIGWQNFREVSDGIYKYEIFGKNKLGEEYKEERTIYITSIIDKKDITYFEINPMKY